MKKKRRSERMLKSSSTRACSWAALSCLRDSQKAKFLAVSQAAAAKIPLPCFRLTQLDPELARSVVRKRATADFGEPPAESEPSGRLTWLANHIYFERLTMAVIFLNAMWISVDLEFNKAEILSEADAGFIVVENMFCLFFSFELFVRLWTYARTCHALRDIWFLFDVFLVLLMSFETWLMPLAHAITQTTGDTMTGGASAAWLETEWRVMNACYSIVQLFDCGARFCGWHACYECFEPLEWLAWYV